MCFFIECHNYLLRTLFGLSLFFGGLVKVIYGGDNADLHANLCPLQLPRDPQFCSDLETVVGTEISSGVSQQNIRYLHCVH